MKHKNSHLLVGYWSRLRKGREVPDQTDIDPRAIKRMLSQLFILDAINPGRPTYRLAGTGLCERFGMELKATPFLAQWEGQSAIALSSLLRQAMRVRQPVCLSSIGAGADSGMVEIETVLAPISFNRGEPTRLLGMTQVLSDVQQLGGRPVAFQRLVASQMIREGEPLANLTAPPPPPPPAMQILRNHARAPHLRLVVSQDRPAVAPTVHRLQSDDMLRRVFEMIGGTVTPA
jgi:hypothetical protein